MTAFILLGILLLGSINPWLGLTSQSNSSIIELSSPSNHSVAVPTLSQNAAELRTLVQEFLQRFHEVHTGCVNGPQADLSAQELRVVEYLGDAGPRMMKEVAEFMPLAVNSVTSLVDNLERRELVRRHRSDEDRRVVRVELTERGQQVYQAAVNEVLSLLKLMLGSLNRDEQEQFMILFRKIARGE